MKTLRLPWEGEIEEVERREKDTRKSLEGGGEVCDERGGEGSLPAAAVPRGPGWQDGGLQGRRIQGRRRGNIANSRPRRSPRKLLEIRHKLRHERWNSSLFDTRRSAGDGGCDLTS
eukprot:756340-Hanusia_phi.AAC.2